MLIVSLFSLLFFENQAFAVDQPESYTERSNSTSHWYGDWMDTYAASSIGFMGASWSHERDVWEFNYRIVGTGRNQYQEDASSENNIFGATMEIKGTSTTNNKPLSQDQDHVIIPQEHVLLSGI